MKTTYMVPELNVMLFSNEDIMEGSDTIIEVGGLYGSAAKTASEGADEAALEEALAVQQLER